MADQFTLSGSYATRPLSGVASFDPQVDAVIDESLTLEKKSVQTVELRVDSAVAVAMGSVTQAGLVVLKVVGGSVTVRLTSLAGNQQSIPVDTLLVLMTTEKPITAIDLTRTPGVDTDVRVLVGQE